MAAKAGGGQGGGSGLACGDECANDAGCDQEPPIPGITCGTCVQTQANTQTDCALEAAFGDACQNDADCSDYVTCVLSQGNNCAQTYADGYEIARQEALLACGGCGDGAG